MKSAILSVGLLALLLGVSGCGKNEGPVPATPTERPTSQQPSHPGTSSTPAAVTPVAAAGSSSSETSPTPVIAETASPSASNEPRRVPEPETRTSESHVSALPLSPTPETEVSKELRQELATNLKKIRNESWETLRLLREHPELANVRLRPDELGLFAAAREDVGYITPLGYVLNADEKTSPIFSQESGRINYGEVLVKLTSALLKAGANPNLPSVLPRRGSLNDMPTVRLTWPDSVPEKVVDKKDLDSVYPLQQAVYFAADHSGAELVKTLLEAGIENVDRTDWKGCSALFNVQRAYGHDSFGLIQQSEILLAVEYLLEAGADANLANHDGETPYHFAIRQLHERFPRPTRRDTLDRYDFETIEYLRQTVETLREARNARLPHH